MINEEYKKKYLKYKKKYLKYKKKYLKYKKNKVYIGGEREMHFTLKVYPEWFVESTSGEIEINVNATKNIYTYISNFISELFVEKKKG